VRVVLVTSIERGGPIEQALLLSRGLAGMGASVLVTCANAELAERFATDGVRAEVAPLRHQADAAGAARVSKLARGADVVHAHDRRSGLTAGALPAPAGGPRAARPAGDAPLPWPRRRPQRPL